MSTPSPYPAGQRHGRKTATEHPTEHKVTNHGFSVSCVCGWSQRMTGAPRSAEYAECQRRVSEHLKANP